MMRLTMMVLAAAAPCAALVLPASPRCATRSLAPTMAEPDALATPTERIEHMISSNKIMCARPPAAPPLASLAARAAARAGGSAASHPLARAARRLFMKGSKLFPQCGFSNTAVQILSSLTPQFETFDVLSDMEIREGIKAYSNWPTIPQCYVDGEFIGGW